MIFKKFGQFVQLRLFLKSQLKCQFSELYRKLLLMLGGLLSIGTLAVQFSQGLRKSMTFILRPYVIFSNEMKWKT
jgi:hypothetical protein